MEKKKAVGRQGWWFAEVDGEALPVAHRYWLNVYDYHDPFKRHEGKNNGRKIREYVEAISSVRRVILSNDDATLDKNGEVMAFSRTTYIAVYAVDGVTFSEPDGLRFRLVKKLHELKP